MMGIARRASWPCRPFLVSRAQAAGAHVRGPDRQRIHLEWTMDATCDLIPTILLTCCRKRIRVMWDCGLCSTTALQRDNIVLRL